MPFLKTQLLQRGPPRPTTDTNARIINFLGIGALGLGTFGLPHGKPWLARQDSCDLRIRSHLMDV